MRSRLPDIMKVDRERLFGCHKTPDLENVSSKYLFTPLSQLFSLILVRTPATPNQITIFWGLLMIVSSILLFFGNYYLNIIAGIGWIVSYALDYSDGDIARYKNLRSKRGLFLDLVNHRATYPLLMFGAGFGAWMTGRTDILGIHIDPAAYLILGFLAGISMVIIMDLGDIFNRSNPGLEIDADDGAAAVEGSLMKNKRLFKFIMDINPLTFTNMMALIVVFAVFDIMDIFVILYGVAYPISTFGRYLILLKRTPGVQS